MLNKAAQKLRAIEGNRFFNRPVAVIFGDEHDFPIGNIQDALVGNSQQEKNISSRHMKKHFVCLFWD